MIPTCNKVVNKVVNIAVNKVANIAVNKVLNIAVNKVVNIAVNKVVNDAQQDDPHLQQSSQCGRDLHRPFCFVKTVLNRGKVEIGFDKRNVFN